MRLPDRIPAARVCVPRRRLLQAAALGLVIGSASVGVAGCSPSGQPDGPDPLIALADQARSDAALAASAGATSAALNARLAPLVTARRAHAAALEQEISRLDPDRSTNPSATAGAPTGTSATASAARPAPATLPAVLDGLTASARAAAGLVPNLPAERVGLVASVAACCATYRAVLG